MTSQIAIFNLECVAVASDSVMTLESGRDRRTLASSEKIFDLGANHRVIAMTFGEARFMKVPWSVLVAEWARTTPNPLSTVPDYARSFVRWLPTRRDLFTPDSQNAFFAWQVRDYYLAIRQDIINALQTAGLTETDWSDLDVQGTVDDAVDDAIIRLSRQDDLQGVNADHDAQYLRSAESRIQEQFNYVFDDVPRTVASDARLLTEVPALILAKDEPWGTDGTLAFIGYGADDVFPTHQVVTFHGMVNDAVRAVWWDSRSVDTDNPSRIMPFAQTEAIDTFLRAYNRDFLSEAHRTVDSVWDEHMSNLDTPSEAIIEVREAMHTRLDDDFGQLSWERFVSPMLSTIDALSRSDMARMAESLVGVQALRAASMAQMPTVGGPIDVVVISRSNGVEWVRRKELALG